MKKTIYWLIGIVIALIALGAADTVTRTGTQVVTGQVLGAGSCSAPAYSYIGELGSGWFLQQAGIQGLCRQGTYLLQVNGTNFSWANTQVLDWTSGAPNATSVDTTLSRASAGVIQANSGTGAGSSGEIDMRTLGVTGSTSGKVSVVAPATASGTMTLPAATDTIVGRATTDTLTNKTLTSPVVNGTPTGTGIPTVTLKKGSGAGTYTSASTTYVQVDSTNLLFTVTIPTGWKLLISSSGRAGTVTAAVAWFVSLADGGVTLVETNGIATGVGVANPFALNWVIAGDGASHTVDLRYKTSNGADSVIIGNGTASDVPTVTFLLTPSN